MLMSADHSPWSRRLDGDLITAKPGIIRLKSRRLKAGKRGIARR